VQRGSVNKHAIPHDYQSLNDLAEILNRQCTSSLFAPQLGQDHFRIISWSWLSGFYGRVAGEPAEDQLTENILLMQRLGGCWGWRF
jgi:hypothetical protein